MRKPVYTASSFFCRHIAKASVCIKCTHMVLRKRALASHYQLIGNCACALVTMIPFALCEKVSIGEHAKENGRKNRGDRERESGRFEVDQRTPAIIIEICALMRTASCRTKDSWHRCCCIATGCYRFLLLPLRLQPFLIQLFIRHPVSSRNL